MGTLLKALRRNKTRSEDRNTLAYRNKNAAVSWQLAGPGKGGFLRFRTIDTKLSQMRGRACFGRGVMNPLIRAYTTVTL